MDRLKTFLNRIARFFREVRAELRKVIWPNRQQTTLYTGVVLVSVVFVAAIIFIIDQVLSLGLGVVIK